MVCCAAVTLVTGLAISATEAARLTSLDELQTLSQEASMLLSGSEDPASDDVGAVGLVGVGGGRGAHRGIRWLRHSATFSPISPSRTSAWRSMSTTAGLANR